ncbi:MAG: co-chaperone GroES [Gammaproteobacteria bacterium]|nr:co-chaperone GroES [Gammaproteobacteria bacterium]
MNIRPLGDRVIVSRKEEEKTTAGGIYIPDSAAEKPSEGEIIAVGKGRRTDNGDLLAMNVVVGEKIIFGKYAGSEVKVDGETYLIMKEEDILGVLG